ncbi:hypothetical protein L9S41_17245 [Geoalkalibacter halelectricus]|uniref:Holin-X, holin superfamily III n=2 Tax=Geoalkalibacter halelectricus TaxID=2847045 RepID=A0ABY5ZL38_9BACT|nr:hypothetical protein [Geoalkalibacter halelectricus]UWZ79406.1 hypothetical protein L9S41_17245 [Geoalkalibacter halelectricus]
MDSKEKIASQVESDMIKFVASSMERGVAMARKRRTWKRSDTVAAVFFGLWLMSLPFRPLLGGLEILVIIVGLIWAVSLWATAVHGEHVPPPLHKEDIAAFEESDESEDLLTNPIYSNLAGNIHSSSDE